MADKCKCPPAGAPDWVLTYGDMMSLLLCFFILLAALSELKKEDEFRAVAEEVQKAFGRYGGGGSMPTDDDPTLSLIKRLEEMAFQQRKVNNRSNAEDPGMEGVYQQVTRVREGSKFVVGGFITFEPGSADLNDKARRELMKIAQLVRGTTNKLELYGHAAAGEMEAGIGSPYPDLWTLSYARTKSVMAFLTSQEVGIKADRLRLIAVADYEPLARRVYTDQTKTPNRRVEVVVSESLVDEFNQPQAP
jgi:chemotaxis protein MotB